MSDAPSLAEIKTRLRAFAKAFRDASNEQQQASIFWTKFYECYGIRPESATIYEQRVSKLTGAVGRIDSFIPGKLIVAEQDYVAVGTSPNCCVIGHRISLAS